MNLTFALVWNIKSKKIIENESSESGRTDLKILAQRYKGLLEGNKSILKLGIEQTLEQERREKEAREKEKREKERELEKQREKQLKLEKERLKKIGR